MSKTRAAQGARNYRSGSRAEDIACTALEADGWTVLARRLRTAAGEIDIVADRQGLLAIVEVKQRATLANAAASLSTRQQKRLLAAGDAVLAAHPDWGAVGVRFDVMLVDASGVVRRIADAFRVEA